jgi:predicted TIM-barrel fold metal-dependent hydrolase
MTTLDPTLFLPEPEPREVKYTVISIDDHVCEPAHTFDGRLPAKLQDRAPRIAVNESGHEVWQFEGEVFSQVGMNALAGRRPETVKLEPFRYDQMRPGCYDATARVRDMDIGGIWASVNFPSMITGFAGRVFSACKDQELGLATMRAWNDWFHEEWAEPYPDRFIPLGITSLADPEAGAAEIRRNAARGFKTVSMPERPQLIGFPSIFETEYWDPIIRACAETDTVISIHVASTGGYPSPPNAPFLQLGATLFGQLSLAACAEWLWSGFAIRYPDLKIAMSEGGIGWVAMLLDRLDNIVDRSGYGLSTWDIRPAEVLQRNFWFCTLDDPSTIDTRHRIGVDRIMLEVDYPHGDGTWPDTQSVVEKYWGHIPDDELRMMCCENAAKLFRHPLPATVLPAK